MEIHAYSELYRDDAMQILGEMMDYVRNDCDTDKDEFFRIFITTGMADTFGQGNPKYITGMSGVELACETLALAGSQRYIPIPTHQFEKTKDYWSGWILAFYQWQSSRTFKDIMSYISFAEIDKLYPTLHEAPPEKFTKTMEAIIAETGRPTKLQIIRKRYGLTQTELSRRSGVNIRSIQMYEQRKKDINKAQCIYLVRLAKVLGCTMEALLDV